MHAHAPLAAAYYNSIDSGSVSIAYILPVREGAGRGDWLLIITNCDAAG